MTPHESNGGGRPAKTGQNNRLVSETLKSMGLTKDESSDAQWLDQQKGCVHIGINAKALQLRAERKLGEIIPTLFYRGGDGSNQHKKEQRSHDDTLAQSQISKTQSSRWQAVARVPEVDFEQYITEHRSKEREPTTSGLILCHRKAAAIKKLKAIETKTPAPASQNANVPIGIPHRSAGEACDREKEPAETTGETHVYRKL